MPPRREIDDRPTCLVLHMRALGEVAFALPLLHALQHAGWRTVSLIQRELAPILEASGLVDHVIYRVKQPRAYLAMAGEIRRQHPRACLALGPGANNSLLARFSGARDRIGYDYAQCRWCLQTVPFEGGGVENYLSLLPSLGVPRTADSYCGLLKVPPAQSKAAAALLEAAGLPPGEPFVALSPISTGKLGVNAYPPESWAVICRELRARGHHVVLVGSAADAQLHREMLQGEGAGRALSLAGQTPVLVLAGVLQRAAALIGVDTGPVHVAAAVGTHCVVLFGPSDPRRTSPCGEGHVVLYRGLNCQPCHTEPCNYEGRCLRELTPEQVLTAAEQIL